jgi:hypothetical protein
MLSEPDIEKELYVEITILMTIQVFGAVFVVGVKGP